LKEFGNKIKRRFSNPVAITSGEGEIINLKLPERQPVNQVVIMEDIAQGNKSGILFSKDKLQMAGRKYL
ncbi:MAG: hypothetical protein ACQEQ0_07945, partial [Bacteroidota bacterium]